MVALRLVLTAVVGTLLALAAAPAANAGGPTSVLLAAPGSHAAALYYTDPAYEQLRDLVGVDAEVVDATGHPDRLANAPAVTVTWMIHDVDVWRIDRIHLDTHGQPWVYTERDDLTPGADGEWYPVKQPNAMRTLLDRLGLMGGESAQPPVSIDTRSQHVAADAAPTTPPASGEVSSSWWAVGGVLVGAALGVAGVRLYPRLRSGRGERQQLVDV